MMPSHLKMLSLKCRQQGIAVISAMLLAALITIVVGRMVWQQRLLISELENQQNATQANIIADAAVQWSRAILTEDANSSIIDHGNEVWATRLPTTPVEGGMVTGFIVDQQQFFNLNNLAKEGAGGENQAAFKRLLSMLAFNENSADTLLDWVDEDDITNGAEGAESIYYQSLNPPYMAANQGLTELGNLIHIKGFNTSSVRKLAAYTTVLPDSTEINVNTASAEVLSFVLPEVTIADAQAIIAARNMAPFSDVSDFNSRMTHINLGVNHLPLSVSSQYFLVTCTAKFERTTLKIESLLHRNGSGWPTVIWKRVG